MEFLQFRLLSVHMKRLIISCGAMLFSPAVLAEALTEAKSIELALSHPDFNRLLESQIDVAQGKLRSAGAWNNPILEVSREEAGNETEYSIWVRQSFQLSGQRHLQRQAAQAALTRQEASNTQQRFQRIALAREYFFQTLYYQQRHLLFAQWLEKVSAAESAIKKREVAGDASGYDRRRISREYLDLLNRQRQNEAELIAARERLLGFITSEHKQQYSDMVGELLPDQLPALESLLQKLEQQSSLLLLQRAVEAARFNARASSRGYIPDLTLGIGQKSIDAPGGDETGLMVSASLPIPVFNRKQGEYQSAVAEAQQLQSEYQIVHQQLQTSVRSLWFKADQQRKNAQLYSSENTLASKEIVEIAEVSYYASEIGVLELIDAYRNALQAEISAFQMALDARLSRIALDRLTEGYSL